MDRKCCVLIGPCQSNQVAVGSIHMVLKLMLCFLKGSNVKNLRVKMRHLKMHRHFYVIRVLEVLSSKGWRDVYSSLRVFRRRTVLIFKVVSRLSEGLRFVVWPGLNYCTVYSSLRVFRRRTVLIFKVVSRLSEGLRFVVWPGLNYKTKTQSASRLLASWRAFERGSSFCSLTRPKLQNEDPVGFASFGVLKSFWARVFVSLFDPA